MDNRYPVSKTQARRSHLNPSEALQATLLDHTTGTLTEIPQSHKHKTQSLVNGALCQETTPTHFTKRRHEATLESNTVPWKRARLAGQDTLQPRAKEQPEPAQTTLQQPKPWRPRHASFLQESIRPDPAPESVHTFILEWLASVGSDRKERCCSDSHLHHSDKYIPRRLTRSVPEMDHTRDADAYMVPLTPASVGSGSYLGGPDIGSVVASDVTGVTPSSGGSSGKSLVQNPLYRIAYLADNKIFLRDREEYPKHIGSLVGEMGKDRDSPGPSPDDVWQDLSLRKLELGAAESTVERYFCTNLLPNPGPTESLMCSYRQPMHRHAVPNTGSNFKISTPVPDMAYGYNRETAFTGAHQTLLLTESSVAANVHDLLYPFLVIEFKGDSPSGSGSLWVATNQCMGGSVSCVNVAERFNHRLGHYQSDEVQPSNTAAFSIAMSGTEARIFVSWKHDEGKYYVQKVDSFLLQSPEGYLKFRKFVLNIIDWGRGRRLNEIRKSLDTLMEESRKGPPKLAKARPSPLAGSETRPSKKLKLSA